MKTLTKTYVKPSALSVLALATMMLAHGMASAAASEEDLKKTKLYGSVSIAEDSVESWGPWSNFEPPAAGPAVSSGMPVRAVELYRPLAQPELVGLGCTGGSLCGFGAYTSYVESSVGIAVKQDSGFYSESLPFAVAINGQVTAAGEGGLPQAIRLFTAPLSMGASVLIPDSDVLSLSVGPYPGYGRYVRGVETETRSEYYEVSGGLLNNPMAEATQVMAGYAVFGIEEYVQGTSSESEGGYRWQGQEGPVVLGFATADADMAALRNSNASATYLGRAMDKGGAPVRIDVQFGSGEWSGSWNGGQDGYVSVRNSEQGAQLYGQVGFTAKGTINGVNLKSTSVGTLDQGATVSGFVQGAFFGPQAAAVGGVVDITKSNPRTDVINPSTPAAVSAPKVYEPVGYTAGKHVSTFLAIDSKLTDK